MEIELFGVLWDRSSEFPDLECSGEPYSEDSRVVICVRPVTLTNYPEGMDSGQIDGRFGLAQRYHEMPVMKAGVMAEFKRASEALAFAKTLDLERVSIDFNNIVVMRPEPV
jgi:hypothetical protein